MATAFATAIFANQARTTASSLGGGALGAGGASLVGVAAGVAFNAFARRAPKGAFALGLALMAHQMYRKAQDAKIKRDAKDAVSTGPYAPPHGDMPEGPAPASAPLIGEETDGDRSNEPGTAPPKATADKTIASLH